VAPASCGGVQRTATNRPEEITAMKVTQLLKLASAAALCASLATVAQAQATRTWVSGVGDDVNPCSRTAPCKTFQGAISKTAAGGEIDVLDPGGFGPVTINKALTIDGAGTNASILASGTNGISVTAGASDVVSIRNISITGIGSSPGVKGIRFASGKELNVENVVIASFGTSPGRGISVETASGTTSQVTVSSSIIRNNTGASIEIAPISGAPIVNVTISDSHLDSNSPLGVGLLARGDATRVVAFRTTFNHNGQAGVQSFNAAQVSLESCSLSHGNNGIQAFNTSIVRLSNATITNNIGTALAKDPGATIATFGNNHVFGNNLDNTGVLTAIAPANF
jgi:hypothetical protein